MSYFKEVATIAAQVPTTIVDFNEPRSKARIPTQATTNFITNKEQGDWAENLIFRAVNDMSKNYVAVKYGKSDDIVAGDVGWDIFYDEFQTELDEIGKRPDILIFKRENYLEKFGQDISKYNNNDIAEYVKQAIAGIEVRSSAFLIDKYEQAMNAKTNELVQNALELKELILKEYREELNHPNRDSYIPVIEGVTKETLRATSFRIPIWKSNERLVELTNKFKTLKGYIKEIQKREYLSITAKVEDIKVVYKWIETFNVPHFYFQVFFDKVYGISFKQILETISDENNEGTNFSIEEDSKNQNKSTIKINSKSGVQIAHKIDEPNHRSVRKEMARGRLLFYVTFEGGTAYLDINNLKQILGVKDEF